MRIKQNKLLRAILGVRIVNGRPVVPTAEMYKTLRILTVKSLFKLYLFKFLFNCLKGNLPYFYNLLLRPLQSERNYNTRGGEFRHPFVNCEVVRRGLKSQMILLYENVEHINLRVSVPIAVKNYRRILFQEQ